MTTPRPDQLPIGSPGMMPGSMSGAGDLAGALGYPGVPPAVPNLSSAEAIQQNVSASVVLFTFPSAGRIWSVVLSYVITSNPSFSLSTIRTYARIYRNPGGTLAIVQLGASNAKQALAGQSEPQIVGGIPVTAGTSLILDVNAGNLVTNMDQQASAVVLYSIP